jgi:hypothetical protein
MPADPIKIQINSVEALNRLLGEDPDILIKVREEVMDKFMEHTVKHLLPKLDVLTSKQEQQVKDITAAACRELFVEVEKSQANSWSRLKVLGLTEVGKTLIRDQVKSVVDAQLAELTVSGYAALQAKIDKVLSNNTGVLQTYIDSKMADMINDRLNLKIAGLIRPLQDLQRNLEADLKAKKAEPAERNITLTL